CWWCPKPSLCLILATGYSKAYKNRCPPPIVGVTTPLSHLRSRYVNIRTGQWWFNVLPKPTRTYLSPTGNSASGRTGADGLEMGLSSAGRTEPIERTQQLLPVYPSWMASSGSPILSSEQRQEEGDPQLAS